MSRPGGVAVLSTLHPAQEGKVLQAELCAAPQFANSLFQREVESAHTVTFVGCLGGFFLGAKWMEGRTARLREQAVERLQRSARRTGLSAYVRHTHGKVDDAVIQVVTQDAVAEPDVVATKGKSSTGSSCPNSRRSSTDSIKTGEIASRGTSYNSLLGGNKVTPLYVTAAKSPKPELVGSKAPKVPSDENDGSTRPVYLSQKSRRISRGFKSSALLETTGLENLPADFVAQIPRRMSLPSTQTPELTEGVPRRSQSMVPIRRKAWDYDLPPLGRRASTDRQLRTITVSPPSILAAADS